MKIIILIIGIIILDIGIFFILVKPNNNKKIIDKDYELNMKLYELYENTEIEETITSINNDDSIIKLRIKNKYKDNININKVRITIYNQKE